MGRVRGAMTRTWSALAGHRRLRVLECYEAHTARAVDLTDTPLEPGAQSADVRVTWHDPESGLEV
jgi:hypothetical protein